MTTWPLRRTQMTVVERIRERCATVELVSKAKKTPPETGRPAGRNSFKMQTQVYRSGKPQGGGVPHSGAADRGWVILELGPWG
jgi:hypothetical protein